MRSPALVPRVAGGFVESGRGSGEATNIRPFLLAASALAPTPLAKQATALSTRILIGSLR